MRFRGIAPPWNRGTAGGSWGGFVSNVRCMTRMEGIRATRRNVLVLGTVAAAAPWLGAGPAQAADVTSGEFDELGITESEVRRVPTYRGADVGF
jgi:amidase